MHVVQAVIYHVGMGICILAADWPPALNGILLMESVIHLLPPLGGGERTEMRVAVKVEVQTVLEK